MPHQPYYESFYDGLAAMVRSIAANHALEDGNKRLAVTVLHSTLLANGFVYFWSNDDAVDVALRCASGETNFVWLSQFIESWTTGGGPTIPLTADFIRHEMFELSRAREEFFVENAEATDSWGPFMSAHARGDLNPELLDSWLTHLRARRATGGDV